MPSSKKTATKNEQKCPFCGGMMQVETRPTTHEYRGQSMNTELTGMWCASCNEGIIDGPELVRDEKEFVEFKAKIDGVLGPAEVTRIRKRLRLSQRRAGEILGGGPRAFQKYESGATAVSQPMSNLLRLLANDPARIKEIA